MDMRVYTYEGIPMVHISTFAAATRHGLPVTRTLLTRERVIGEVEGGVSKRRPVKYFRDGVTVWIPVAEITGYPFIRGTQVFHYDMNGEKHLCEICTYTNGRCQAAQEAEDLVMPVGDP